MIKNYVDTGFTVIVYFVNENHCELEFHHIRHFDVDDNSDISVCEEKACSFADDMVKLGYFVTVYKEQICKDYINSL